jgi:hypothetical protein
MFSYTTFSEQNLWKKQNKNIDLHLGQDYIIHACNAYAKQNSCICSSYNLYKQSFPFKCVSYIIMYTHVIQQRNVLTDFY